MRMLPRSAKGTWLLATAVWTGMCAVVWWRMPEQLNRRALIEGADLRPEVTFAPDGRWLATFGISDGQNPRPLQFWDTATGKPLALLKDSRVECHELIVSPDGRWLLTVAHHFGTGHSDELRVWDARNGEKLAGVEVSSFRPHAHRFSPPGPFGVLLACCDETGDRDCVRLFELPSLKAIATLPAAARPLAFSADGRFLATRDMSGSSQGAMVWEIANGKPVVRAHPKPLSADDWHRNPTPDFVALTTTGDRLVIFTRHRVMSLGNPPESIHIVDVPSGKMRAEWPNVQIIGLAGDSGSIVFGDVDKSLVHGRLRIADLHTGVEQNSLDITHDRRTLYPPGRDRYLAMTGGQWLVINESFEPTYQSCMNWLHDHFAWIPAVNSQTSACGVYEIETGQRRCQVTGVSRPQGFLLSPDGQMLAVRRSDWLIEILDMPPNKPLSWFALAAAGLALPIAGLAWRRVRRLRREAA